MECGTFCKTFTFSVKVKPMTITQIQNVGHSRATILVSLINHFMGNKMVGDQLNTKRQQLIQCIQNEQVLIQGWKIVTKDILGINWKNLRMYHI